MSFTISLSTLQDDYGPREVINHVIFLLDTVYWKVFNVDKLYYCEELKARMRIISLVIN